MRYSSVQKVSFHFCCISLPVFLRTKKLSSFKQPPLIIAPNSMGPLGGSADLSCTCHLLYTVSGFPDFVWVLSPLWAWSPCSVLPSSIRLAWACPKGGSRLPVVRVQVHKASGGLGWNWHDISPTALYWPKQVTNPAHIQGKRKETRPFDVMRCQVTLQRVWWRSGAISANS